MVSRYLYKPTAWVNPQTSWDKFLGCIQNMDWGPWTTPLDRVHGPPHHGPGPWTTPNFQKEIAPGNFIWKFTKGQCMKNTDSYFNIAYILEGLPRKSVLFWDSGAMNGKTTNSFWDTEDLVHFHPQYFHSNTFKLQFDREDTNPPPRQTPAY